MFLCRPRYVANELLSSASKWSNTFGQGYVLALKLLPRGDSVLAMPDAAHTHSSYSYLNTDQGSVA